MTREQIDAMWQKAMHQSIADGEQFTRYHFAHLIASHVAEECAKEVDHWGEIEKRSGSINVWTAYVAAAIRSLYKPTS